MSLVHINLLSMQDLDDEKYYDNVMVMTKTVYNQYDDNDDHHFDGDNHIDDEDWNDDDDHINDEEDDDNHLENGEEDDDHLGDDDDHLDDDSTGDQVQVLVSHSLFALSLTHSLLLLRGECKTALY